MRPIYLSQPAHLKRDLHRVQCLVWSGLGIGWEAGSSDSFTFDGKGGLLDTLRECQPKIKLALVCLRYGAKAAAERLQAALGGRLAVAWLPFDLCSDDGQALQDILLETLLPPRLQPPSALAAAAPGSGVLLSLGAVDLPDFRPEGQAQATEDKSVINLAQRAGNLTNLLEPAVAGMLRDLEPLSCDVEAISQLRDKLRDVRQSHRLMVATERSGTTPPEYDSHPYGCRAVAHAVCRSFLQAAAAFRVICRVACDMDVSKLAELAAAEGAAEGRRCLVWVDVVLRGSLSPTAIQRLAEFVKEQPRACVLVTAEPTSQAALSDTLKLELFPVASGHMTATASSRHDEIKLVATSANGQTPLCLLDVFEPEQLQAAFRQLAPGERSVAALYRDDDLGCIVRISVSDVGYLHALRDEVLEGRFELNLLKALQDQPRKAGAQYTGLLLIRADRTQFAEQYERSALSLTELTDHQKDTLELCKGEDGHFKAQIHVMAPAGAGKTFLALHIIIDALRCAGPKPKVLFVARNKALCIFVARWVAERAEGKHERDAFLRSLHLLFEDAFQVGPHAVWYVEREGQIATSMPSAGAPSEFDLVCVDEAHHIYRDVELRRAVEKRVGEASRRVLLSDISQSRGRDLPYPEGMAEVTLTEVVRCSKRIVQAASTFQLGGEEAKLHTQCHHAATGPPVKSFLFELEDGASDEERFSAYTDKVGAALSHVTSSFDGLRLHNRVAILVPDAAFRDALKPRLVAAFAESSAGEQRLRLMDAKEASCMLLLHNTSMAVARHRQESDAGDAIVLDTLENFDGLERLIVIAVGLDAKLDADDAEDVLETRSRMYRALTRAHMLALVVNEGVRGGWLEWLNKVRLNKNAAFDREAELAKQKADAAQSVVNARLAEIDKALEGLAEARKEQLTSEEAREIRQRVNEGLGDVRKRGASLTEEDVVAKVEEKLPAFLEQREALRAAAAMQNVELTTAQALALQRRMEEQQSAAGEGTAASTAAAAVVGQWAAVPAALEAAIGASQLTVSADERSALSREAHEKVQAG